MTLLLACRPENDLFRVLVQNGAPCLRCDTPAQAIAQASPSSGVLLLADDYPEQMLAVDAVLLETAVAKALRLYIEYPRALPDIPASDAQEIAWERAVVTSAAFAPTVPEGRILMMHGCRFLPVPARPAHIALARVAGFETAVYGLPANNYPILFEQSPTLLVATTKLSQFVTARFAPTACWRSIWGWILQWADASSIPPLQWTPTVHPSYGPDAPLPPDAEAQACRRGMQWFHDARMFIDASWQPEAERRIHAFPDGTGRGPDASWPCGNGRHGVLEGVSSGIHADGTQDVRYFLRNDCNGETAMAMACSGTLMGSAEDRAIAANLGDFLYLTSNLARNHRTAPDSPLHGLLPFSADDLYGFSYYGDDTANSTLGMLATAGLLDDGRWNEAILRTLLANLRTTGPQGFRGNRLEEQQLLEKGWRYFWETPRTNYRPHYESWLWACYLRAWEVTGFRPFLDRACTAIRLTMAAYPDQWRWANGMQQERARMLLPLAWLVRIDDTAEHRAWLRCMAGELLSRQDACGAIREELGIPEMGSYNPPSSNEAYGVDEAPLIQQNGDPLCDLLYTMNFALVGLHEATVATGDAYYADAEDRLARFLCRIQVRAEQHPELDGAWFRAFDYRDWEYWASNSDMSWGAWCVETGWTQAWIAAMLALRLRGLSLWEITGKARLADHLQPLVSQMLPEEMVR